MVVPARECRRRSGQVRESWSGRPKEKAIADRNLSPSGSSSVSAPSHNSRHRLLTTARELGDLREILAGEDIVAFDTEFLRERTFFPQLGLIQIASRKQSWLIDPVGMEKPALEPLRGILRDPRSLKVAHAIEQDQECLLHTFGFLAEPVLDTSIGAALVGMGEQIGLSTLLLKLMNVRLPKGHTRTDWLKRPLPASMLEYAIADVAHLAEGAERLIERLESRGRRDWAMALSAEFCDPRRFEPRPEALATRLAIGNRLRPKEFSVLRELVRWREERVRRSDIPRSWLAEDKLLVKLAIAQPATKEDLETFRGLGSKTVQHGASEILSAIEKGRSVSPDKLPRVPEREDPTGDEASALSVLKCFLQILAREHHVAVRFVVEPDGALGLLRGSFESLDDLRSSGLLSGDAVELFGEQLLDILQGRTTLRLKNGELLIGTRAR